MNYENGKYVKYCFASKTNNILIDAIHAHPPRSEYMAKEIVEAVTGIIGCNCIIATVSRVDADLNRHRNKKNGKAVDEYRAVIKSMLEQAELVDANGKLKQPFLHVGVHGMMDRPDNHLEIGTVFGESCSREIEKTMHDLANKWADSMEEKIERPKILLNEQWFGDPSIAAHRIGDQISNYPGYGDNYNMVQIEIANYLRIDYFQDSVNLLCAMFQEFISLHSTKQLNINP